MTNVSAHARGFTLIELIVTLGIMSLLLVSGIPAFRSFGRATELTQASQDVRELVLRARSFSLSPRAEKPPAIDQYSVTFTPGAHQVRIHEGPTVIAELALPTDVRLVEAPPVISFAISPPGLVVTPAGTERIPPIVLVHANLARAGKRQLELNRVTGQMTVSTP